MRRFEDTRSVSTYSDTLRVLGLLAGAGEEAAAEPENLEGILRRMIDGLRDALGLGALSLSASVGEGRGVSASSGMAGGEAAEFAIVRGKTRVVLIRAYPAALDAWQGEALRAAAGVAALVFDAAHAREVAAQKTAQGSVVQIASEALGVIKEEKDLYRTVLVLTLELLDASGGAILLADGGVVSLGFEGSEGTLEGLREVRFLGRGPWMGRIGGHHTLGVGLGDDEGGGSFSRARRGRTPRPRASP